MVIFVRWKYPFTACGSLKKTWNWEQSFSNGKQVRKSKAYINHGKILGQIVLTFKAGKILSSISLHEFHFVFSSCDAFVYCLFLWFSSAVTYQILKFHRCQYCHYHHHHLVVKEWVARSSVVGWGTMLQAGRSQILFLMRSLNFFNLPNPTSCTMALGLT
jgi:hypothetical protein